MQNVDFSTLNNLRDAIYEDAVKHGLWETPFVPLSYKNVRSKKLNSNRILIGEIEEYINAETRKEYEDELADIIIACFSSAGYLKINLEKAVKRKCKANSARPYQHGKFEEVK